MSQFDDPQPPAPPPAQPQDGFEAEMMPTGPAPMSGMAVAGFVSSLIVCCPVLSPLLGLIFSLVGLSQTKGGARRGRGLAIAGLIITVVVGLPLQVISTFWSVNFFGDEVKLVAAVTSLDSSTLDARAAVLYELASSDLASEVSEAEFTEWLGNQLEALGGVQSIAMNQQQPMSNTSAQGNRFQFRFTAQFPEKTVDLLFDIGLELGSGHWRIEDVIIDGNSLLSSLGVTGDPESEPSNGE